MEETHKTQLQSVTSLVSGSIAGYCYTAPEVFEVTRYLILCGSRYVAAAQPDTRRILLTEAREDAGVWATYERTIKAARFVEEITKTPVVIQSVKEPDYPESWKTYAENGDVV